MIKKYLGLLIFSSNLLANPDLLPTNIETYNSNSGYENPHKLIVGNEFNVYRNTLYENAFLQYYSTNYVIGLQSLNIRMDGVQMQNYEMDSYINGSYKFDLTDNLSTEIGSKIGTNFSNTSASQQLHTSSFIDLGYQINEQLSIHAGSYYVNNSLATKHQPFNAQAGLKYKYNNIIVLADYYSGSNNLSGAVINIAYQLLPRFRPYVGIQVPETNSGNEFAGNIGFTFKLN